MQETQSVMSTCNRDTITEETPLTELRRRLGINQVRCDRDV